jgi:hypothetical protein
MQERADICGGSQKVVFVSSLTMEHPEFGVSVPHPREKISGNSRALMGYAPYCIPNLYLAKFRTSMTQNDITLI